MPWKKRDDHMLVVGLEAKLFKGADSSKLLLAIFQTQNMWILDLFGMKITYFLIGIAYWVWIYFSDISSKVYDLHLNFSDVLKYMTNILTSLFFWKAFWSIYSFVLNFYVFIIKEINLRACFPFHVKFLVMIYN